MNNENIVYPDVSIDELKDTLGLTIKKDDVNKLVHSSIISPDEKIINNQYVMVRIIPRVFNDIGRSYMSHIGIQKKWGDKTNGITYASNATT